MVAGLGLGVGLGGLEMGWGALVGLDATSGPGQSWRPGSRLAAPYGQFCEMTSMGAAG